jgi:hypothetical protein
MVTALFIQKKTAATCCKNCRPHENFYKQLITTVNFNFKLIKSIKPSVLNILGFVNLIDSKFINNYFFIIFLSIILGEFLILYIFTSN